MQPSQKLNWLETDTNTIFEHLKQKRDDEKQKSRQAVETLKELETYLIESISSLHSAEMNLMNGGDECGIPFVHNMQKYMDNLNKIGNTSTNLDSTTFPNTLCEYIDQGKNPDIQMKNFYQLTKEKNNKERGRIVNTHNTEQYLKDGQKCINQWTQKTQ
eukprot:68937_1